MFQAKIDISLTSSRELNVLSKYFDSNKLVK